MWWGTPSARSIAASSPLVPKGSICTAPVLTCAPWKVFAVKRPPGCASRSTTSHPLPAPQKLRGGEQAAQPRADHHHIIVARVTRVACISHSSSKAQRQASSSSRI